MDQVWYHGTTYQTWVQIQAEQSLWGVHATIPGRRPRRWTDLVDTVEEAQRHASAIGSVVLRVTYVPMLGQDNYEAGSNQVRVYDPIPIWDVELLNPDEVSGLREIPQG